MGAEVRPFVSTGALPSPGDVQALVVEAHDRFRSDMRGARSGKSGIGGGIVTVSPGKGGLGTFAPLLDQAGNSIKGQLVARFLADRLGLDLFVSAPEGE